MANLKLYGYPILNNLYNNIIIIMSIQLIYR